MDNVGLNMAITIAANSFNAGGNWGFLSKRNPDYDKIYKILISSRGGYRMYNVYNGVIVIVPSNYIYSAVTQVEEVTPEVLDRQKNRVNYEIPELQKYLASVIRKMVKPTNITEDYEEYTFAIYSCNTMHKLRLNGIEYPAFSVSEIEVIKELAKLRKYADIYLSVENGFKSMADLTGNAGVDEVIKGLEISDTLTGVFMTIRIVRH